MSQMIMFIIAKNGDLEVFAEFGNAARAWFMLWSWIEEKYMPVKPGKFSVFITRGKERESFWNLAYDAKVAEHDRTCLRASYDGAMIKKETMPIVAAAFKKLGSEMISDPGHMFGIAEQLEKAFVTDCIGVCFQGTTVDADQWNEGRIYKNHESRPFNIFKDKNYGHVQYWIDPMNLDGDEESLQIKSDD